jgi:hypothetical protein
MAAPEKKQGPHCIYQLKALAGHTVTHHHHTI